MATRIIPGTLREVWQELAPLNGGAAQVISTGIVVGPVAASGLARFLATLYVTPVAGLPVITATVARVNGRAAVTVTNTAAPGNTATFVLDITKLQSAQQGTGGLGGVVHVVAPGAIVVPVPVPGLLLPPTDVNIAVYPVVATDVRLAVRRTATGTCQVEFPSIAATPLGRTVIVNDTGRNAGINNISVVPNGADTINGIAATYVMRVSNECLWFASNSVTNDWELI